MDSFGNRYKITIFGESHTPELGITIEGVPSGIPLSINDFTEDLYRRKSGSKGTTPRNETDLPILSSGIAAGQTTGTPITIIFQNRNIQSSDYDTFTALPRPGHADFTAVRKYCLNESPKGGGRFSGRMTLPLVAAGVVAKKIIAPIRISARIIEAGGVPIEGNPLENNEFAQMLERTAAEGDSLGGIIECRCEGVPIGLGEPFFDSLESQISHAVFSIPGVRGIEFGDGFKAARMKGSEHNDCFVDGQGHTSSNGAGGINGGISNGNPIVFRIAVKPPSSISKMQESFNFQTNQMESFSIGGRHDCCFALRLPVVVESVAACVIAEGIV